MYPHTREASQQQQTLLQQRLDELSQHSLFLQEMFQSWEDLRHLSLPDEEHRAFFAYLQRESLHFRQALQHLRYDLQQERKRRREERDVGSFL
jgi:hypothetical protein